MYEELFLDMEKALSTKHPKIFRVIEDEKYSDEEITNLMKKLYSFSIEKNMKGLKELIDQYIPDNQIEFKGGSSDAYKPERVFETGKS